MTAPKPQSLPRFKTDADERRYHSAMSKLTASRGFLNLSQAHALAAKDCPEGCQCDGCCRTRKDVEEAKEIRRKRTGRAPRAAA